MIDVDKKIKIVCTCGKVYYIDSLHIHINKPGDVYGQGINCDCGIQIEFSAYKRLYGSENKPNMVY